MKTKRELAVEIFGLIFDGDRDAKSYALSLLSKLNHDERQELRQTCLRLGKLIDEHWRATTFRKPNTP